MHTVYSIYQYVYVYEYVQKLKSNSYLNISQSQSCNLSKEPAWLRSLIADP